MKTILIAAILIAISGFLFEGYRCATAYMAAQTEMVAKANEVLAEAIGQ